MIRVMKLCSYNSTKLMINKINWLAWLVLVILWNYGFPKATPLQDVLVAIEEVDILI